MRDIIFKAKRLDNGEWIQGDLRHWRSGRVGIHDEMTHRTVEVDPETVGQYSGLYDKNGKLIFEGDIILIPDDYDIYGKAAGEKYEVYFAFGGFRLKPKDPKYRGFWLEDNRTVEVTGNIHDNPELLKVGK